MSQDGLHAILEEQLLFLDVDAFEPLGFIENSLALKFLKPELTAGMLGQQLSILLVALRKRPLQVLLDMHHRPKPPDFKGRSSEGGRDSGTHILTLSLPSPIPPRKVDLHGNEERRRARSRDRPGLDPQPHDDRVLAGIGIVLLAAPDGDETGLAVQGKSRLVARSDLEGDLAAPLGRGVVDQELQETGPHPPRTV